MGSTKAAVVLGKTGAGAGTDSVDDAAEVVVGVDVDGGVETDVMVAVVVVSAASFVSSLSEQPVINRAIETKQIAAIAFITVAFTTKPRRPRLEYLLGRALGHRRTGRRHYSGACR